MQKAETLSSLAAEYRCNLKTFKKLILFLHPQLEKLQVIDSPILTPAQVVLIRYKLGAAKDRKYTYTVIAKLIGIDLDTLLYSWLKPTHYEKMKELQPTKMSVLTPRQVDYILSIFDANPTEIN
jgi:hypothetical protein